MPSKKYDALLNVIMVGNTAVGKTGMLNRYLTNVFRAGTFATMGFDFQIKKLKFNNKTIKLKIWDTSGVEKFRELIKTSYKGVNIALVLYDISSKDSFSKVDSWITEVKAKGDSNISILLVGNKCDLEKERQVTKEQALKKANQFGIAFCETSALLGVNVEKAFNTIIKEALIKMKILEDEAGERNISSSSNEAFQKIIPEVHYNRNIKQPASIIINNGANRKEEEKKKNNVHKEKSEEKSEEKKDISYVFKKNFIINISVVKRNLLKIKINNVLSTYTYGEMIDYDRRFRGFDSIKKIRSFILTFIQKQEIEIKNKNILILKGWGDDITIFPKIQHSLNYNLNNFFNQIIYFKHIRDFGLKFKEIKASCINSLCFLKDSRLVSSGDNRIVIYNKDTYQSDLIIKNDKNVESICGLTNGNLASSDYNINIFKIYKNNYELIHTLQGHNKKVNKVIELEEGRLCSCSEDTTIKIWDKEYKCIETLVGHNNNVKSIIQINNNIISADDDGIVNIWNKNTHWCIKVIQNIYCHSENGISKLANNTVILGGNKILYILDTLSYNYTQFKNNELGEIYSICLFKDDKALLGNQQGQIICFDSTSNHIIFIQEMHKSIVTCIIKTEDNKIFSSSKDKTINAYERNCLF